ncbi:MAG: 5'-nucleotidase C-terminal domain-containing protein, partial [Chloroflexota bacterium]|nr:5'-nucleotidase C-terminal domain-containing protein [Chloroflexota bacterium]
LDLSDLRLGLIGITSEMWGTYETRFGLRTLPVLPLVEEMIAALRQDGADAVILLSHMGLRTDRELAEALTGIPLILGAHSHDLLPEGERVGSVVIVQAGWNGEHLGRIDLLWDGERLTVDSVAVLPVDEWVSPSPAVLAEAERAERDLEDMLSEMIGEIAQPLGYAEDRECGVLSLLADVLRDRMRADVGLVTGPHLTGPLPAGRLTRRELWGVCHFTANPAAANLSGVQLSALVARGLDPELARERPRPLRGQPRGLMHLSGVELRDSRLLVGGEPVDQEQTYRVAASDWELSYYGGYVEQDWNLQLEYDSPTILREALEEYIRTHSPVGVTTEQMQDST